MNNFPLPNDLPVPINDGAADHLTGLAIPAIEFKATDGSIINLHQLEASIIIYIYPRTGKPGQPLP